MANKKLSATITIGGAVASSLKSAFGSVKGGVAEVGSAIRNAERQQKLLSQSIQTFGKQGRNVDGMRERYAQLTQQIDKMRAAQQRLNQVQQAQKANLDARENYRGQILDTVALGATVASPVVMAARFETAMLGVAKQVDGARDSSGKLTAVYYEMGKQIQQLGREIPLATNEIADMVTAGSRMGVARDQLIDFTRTSAMMADAFELPAGELADNMGKIAGLFKIPIPAIGELADSINYLDDNAISKGGDIIEFLTRTGGVASAVKVTGQEMAALGSTLLTLGERTETAGTATNAMFQKFAAADKGTKNFKSALKELGISSAAVQKGMQQDATGTMMKVLSAIGKLPKEKQLGVMVELVGLEHSDTLAKLANNTEEWRRQLALANSEAAKGSMSREFAARLQTTNAQWQLMKNRTSEVAVNLGSVLLPAINDTFKAISPLVNVVADFARENPKVTKAIVGTAVALTSLKVGGLAVGYAFTFVKGAALSTVGLFYRVSAGAAVAGASTASAAAGPTMLGKAFMFAGKGIIWMGRSLLMNPIGLAITAIAGAAYLIYENWDKLKPWFTALWDDIVAKFETAVVKIGGMIDSVKQKWNDTKDAVTGGVGSAWASTKEFFGFGDNKGQSKPASLPSNLPLPAIASSRSRGNTYQDNSKTTVQVTQLPGESQQALAKRIVAEQERMRSVRQRSMMTDGVIAQ
ncbi:phage tail tape measure protein [Aeromonas enteropelogenes]|uniref:phage tail tape measure protein n=1 Tax=Aeromonas enteropelogenes TaxID=29489 RepID=UPI003BA39D4F